MDVASGNRTDHLMDYLEPQLSMYSALANLSVGENTFISLYIVTDMTLTALRTKKVYLRQPGFLSGSLGASETFNR
jgi:hypothetical protein